jgi:hypothetical protein
MPVTVPRFIYRLHFSANLMLRSFASLLFGCLILVTVACSKDEEKKTPSVTSAQLGEPVGAEVPARGNVPAISLALAISKGQDPVQFLPQVVGAVAAAVSGCPAFVASSQDKEVTAVNFTLENGKMKVPPRADSPGIKCLATALDGKDAGPAGSNVAAARVEIKVPAAGAKTP